MASARENTVTVEQALDRATQPISAIDLAEQTGLSKSTVQRVLRTLESAGTAESIEDGEHRQRLLYRRVGASAGEGPLDLLEALSAVLALAGAAATFGSLLEGQLDALIGRLGRESKGSLAKLLPTARELVTVPKRGRVKYAEGHVEMLEEFLRGAATGRAVQATYKSPWRPEPRTGVFALSKLVPSEGALYLLLDDVDRPERRPAMYALHRFLRADVLRDRAAQPDRARAERVVSPTLEPWVSDAPIDAVVRVAPEWAVMFGEREWVAGQKVSPETDGGLRFQARFPSKELLFQFVLWQAPWLTLVEPVALRGELAEQLEGLAKRHRVRVPVR